jgi:hypothetical protein
MTQYDPIAIKSGVLTVLSTDTMRADLESATITGVSGSPVSGDACQLSADMTLVQASSTSAQPIAGIYNGTSLVRDGIVVANFAEGPTTCGEAVYLSSTAGQLTNAKPTIDMLHEVGVVVDVASSRILLQQKPVIELPEAPPTHIWTAGNGNMIDKHLITGAHVASYNPFTVGNTAWWVVFDGTRIWTTYNTNPGQIAAIHATTGAITGPITVGNYPAITFSGTHIWVNDYFSPYQIYKLDLAGNIVGTYSAGSTWPCALCYDGIDSIWIGNYSGDNNIRKMRCSDGAITATVAMGADVPVGMCSTGTNLWVGYGTQVKKVRLSDNTLLGTYALGYDWGGPPCWDGTRIWQSSERGAVRRWTEATGADLGAITYGFNYNGGGKTVAFDGTCVQIWHQYGGVGSDYGVHRFLASDGSYVGSWGGSGHDGAFLAVTKVLPWP